MTTLNNHVEVVAKTDELTREQWLEYRRAGIGGSDAASILGKSRYKSAFALWADKRGEVEHEDNTNEAMTWGNELEFVVAQRFAREYECAVIAFPALLKSKAFPFMFANVDFFVPFNDDNKYEAGTVTVFDGDIAELPQIQHVLEIKTTGIVGYASRAWDDNNVPPAYDLQGRHYSIVCGVESVIYAALVAGQGLQVRGRVYNDVEANKELVDAERAFWSMVQSGEAPDVDGSESSFDAIKALHPSSIEGTSVEADDFLLATISEYNDAKNQFDAVEARVEELRAKIVLAIGDAEMLTHDAVVLATYKSTKSGTTVDTKALVAHLKETSPDLITQYTKTKNGYRVLRFKEGN